MPRVHVIKQVPARVPRTQLEKALAIIKRQLNLKSAMHVAVAVVSPNEIRKWNKKYRRQDKVTDILSFTDHDDDNFLGDLLICSTKITSQAKQKNHTPSKEFTILFVHGVLHLLGYDHEVAKDATVMEGLEKEILIKLYKSYV